MDGYNSLCINFLYISNNDINTSRSFSATIFGNNNGIASTNCRYKALTIGSLYWRIIVVAVYPLPCALLLADVRVLLLKVTAIDIVVTEAFKLDNGEVSPH